MSFVAAENLADIHKLIPSGLMKQRTDLCEGACGTAVWVLDLGG